MWLMYHIKFKDLLDMYQQACGPFCVLLLTGKRLKGLSNMDFVYAFQQRAFWCLRVTCSIRRCMQKLGHDIPRYVSKFRWSERDISHDNQFFIGKKPSWKHFEKNNSNKILNYHKVGPQRTQ